MPSYWPSDPHPNTNPLPSSCVQSCRPSVAPIRRIFSVLLDKDAARNLGHSSAPRRQPTIGPGNGELPLPKTRHSEGVFQPQNGGSAGTNPYLVGKHSGGGGPFKRLLVTSSPMAVALVSSPPPNTLQTSVCRAFLMTTKSNSQICWLHFTCPPVKPRTGNMRPKNLF